MTTTAERIEDIIRDAHEQDKWGRVERTNSEKAALVLAAEFDAMTALLSEALDRVALLENLARTGSAIAHAFQDENKRLKAELEKVALVAARIPWGFNLTFDPTNLAASLEARIEEVALKVKAWDALVAWQKAERNPDVTENEVFPLMLAYEEAAKAARGW